MASVRQQINIAASQRAVWRQLTTPEGVSAWWVDSARLDPQTGGRVVLTSTDESGEALEERGILLEFRPTRKVEFKWDGGGRSPTAGSRVAFQLASDGDETRVSVIHSGAFLDDAAVHERYDKEWRAALKALRTSLEGEES